LNGKNAKYALGLTYPRRITVVADQVFSLQNCLHGTEKFPAESSRKSDIAVVVDEIVGQECPIGAKKHRDFHKSAWSAAKAFSGVLYSPIDFPTFPLLLTRQICQHSRRPLAHTLVM
jgi:hypothetical protein